MSDRRTISSTVLNLPIAPCLVMLVGVVACFAWSRDVAPDMPWNNVKLAPAVAIWHDYTLYPPLDGSPLTDWVQGPVGALIYSVSIVGGSATGMLTCAMLIQFLAVLLPALALMLRCARYQPERSAIGFAILLGFTFATDAGLNILLTLVLDSLAMSFLLMALLTLNHNTPNQSITRTILCGLLLALGIWTKQTLIFSAAGFVVVSMLLLGLRNGLRIACATAIWCSLLLALFSIIFGLTNMKFWMWDVISRHPWIEIFSEQPRPISEVLLISLNAIAPAAVLLAFASIHQKILRSWRALPRDVLFLCAIAVAQLPAAVIGLAKAGGWLNHPGVVAFYLAIAAACVLSIAPRDPNLPTHSRRAGAWVAILIPLAVLWYGDSAHKLRLAVIDESPNQLQRAESLVRQHPGLIHLPWTPLATLSIEQRLDHIEYGLYDLKLAGIHLPRELYLQGLPPGVQFIAYTPSPLTTLAPEFLPEITPIKPIDQLPGFTLYRVPRTAPPTTDPQNP